MTELLDALVASRYLGWAPPWAAALIPPLGAILIYAVLSRVFQLWKAPAEVSIWRIFVRRTRGSVYLLLAILIGDWSFRRVLALQAAPPAQLFALLDRVIPLLTVAAVAFLVIRAVGTLFEVLRRQFDTAIPDNLRARRAVTHVMVLERVVTATLAVAAAAMVLMTIPEVRGYGTSLLASAGVATLVIGLAAQQTIGNVLAGIQLAITQPLRIDDAVVIEGEWGRVEEITLTYVVVRIWDKRRLIVPITRLLQEPFQNWTRTGSSILGTVLLHVDYTCNIDALRLEQSKLLATSELWDGEVDAIQVTDCTERTMVLRCLVSAAEAAKAWDLRVQLREHLIRHLQQHQPTALPRERIRLAGRVNSARPDDALLP